MNIYEIKVDIEDTKLEKGCFQGVDKQEIFDFKAVKLEGKRNLFNSTQKSNTMMIKNSPNKNTNISMKNEVPNRRSIIEKVMNSVEKNENGKCNIRYSCVTEIEKSCDRDFEDNSN